MADLVADTFVAAIDAAASYDPRRGQVLPWLIGIAHNKLHRWYRQRGSDRDLARRVVGRRLLDADDIGQLEERIDAAALAPLDLLTQLSADQRELIDLVEIQGFTPTEVAKVLGVTAGVARIRLYRARKALRRQLEVVRKAGAARVTPDNPLRNRSGENTSSLDQKGAQQ